MKQIGQGRTADILEYEPGTIIKLYREGMPDEAVRREFEVSKLVCDSGIDSPEALERIQIDGRHGIVFRRVTGVTLLQMISKRLWSIGGFSKQLAALHRSLHTRNADGRLGKQAEALGNGIKAAPHLTDGEKERILRYIDELPAETKICHGDFHPDNIIVGSRSWIIDWMTGTAGSPAADVARTVLLLTYGTLPEEAPLIVKNVLQLVRTKLRKQYVSHYLMLSGMNYSEIDRWMLPVAAARLAEWVPEEEKKQLLMLIRKRLAG